MQVEAGDEEDINGINITPLVDVGLVLVLIFMTTMPLSVIHGIDVNRQLQKKYGLTTPQENITFHLTEKGMFLEGADRAQRQIEYADYEGLIAEILKRSKEKNVFLRVERGVPHGQTVWAMDAAKHAGAEGISLLETE